MNKAFSSRQNSICIHEHGGHTIHSTVVDSHSNKIQEKLCHPDIKNKCPFSPCENNICKGILWKLTIFSQAKLTDS